MNTYANDTCRMATIGYDLDGGGYAFEPSPHFDEHTCVWNDPDCDYFPIGDDMRCAISGEMSEVHFRPFMGEPEGGWPESYHDKDGDRWELIGQGRLYTTDRDCNCHGKPDPEGLAGVGWTFTGDAYNDPARPDCHRCEGDGYVESPGGAFAVYVMRDAD